MVLKLLIKVTKRIIVLVALYTPLVRALEIITSIFKGVSSIEDLVGISVSTLLIAIITYTLITEDSLMFAIAIVTSILGLSQQFTIPVFTIICLLLYLILDTISIGFRGGELEYLKFPWRTLLKAPLTLLVIIVPAILLTYYIGYFTTLLVTGTLINPQLELKPQVAVILTSPLTRLLVIAFSIIYLYSVLENTADIIVGFTKSSYTIALNRLLDSRDLDVIHKPLLTWIFYLSFAALIYTPVYVMIFDILLGGVYEEFLARIPIFISRYIVPLALYGLIALLVRYLYILVDPLEASKYLLYTSIALLLLTYISAVKLVFYEKGWYGLLQPGFQQLGVLLQEKFIDYGRVFITALEMLFRLLGVAP